MHPEMNPRGGFLLKARFTLKAVMMIALIALLGAIPAAATEPGTFDTALAKAAELGQPLVIDFYTDW
jgi:hypothetical protein